VSREMGVPVHLDSTLKGRLQNLDKKGPIELYHELLRSGHSVREILEAINSIQSKAAHENTATMGYSQAKPSRAPTDIAAEGAPAKGAQANTQRIPGVSASQGVDVGSTEALPAIESMPLKLRESDEGEQLRNRLSGSEPHILGLVAAPTSTSRDATLRRNDLDQIRLGGFPRAVRRIASRTLYTAVVASAAVVGFSILNGDRYIQPMMARVLSGISSGIETAVIPSAAIGRAEAVEKISNSTMRVVDTDPSRVPVPFRPTEPDPAVPDPTQRVAAEVQAMISAALDQANAPHELETDRRQDATLVSASTPATSATMTLREALATAAMKADATGGTEAVRILATEPAAAAVPAPTNAFKPDPESHDIASAASAAAEHGIEGDHGGVRMVNSAATARAEQPDAVHPPTREAAAAAPESRIAEIALEDPQFKTMPADALVTRGDAFFAAGDLASARLFYEHAVAAGNGIAALRLGGTFDPSFLARARIGRVQGDAAIAWYWYRRARDLGNGDAEILLKRMENTTR
jgi:hypothetical protein